MFFRVYDVAEIDGMRVSVTARSDWSLPQLELHQGDDCKGIFDLSESEAELLRSGKLKVELVRGRPILVGREVMCC